MEAALEREIKGINHYLLSAFRIGFRFPALGAVIALI